MIFVLSACHTDSTTGQGISETTEDITTIEPILNPYDNWLASYYRSDWQGNHDENVTIIRSVNELQDYATQVASFDSVRLSEEVFDNTTKYNDDYFNQHSLVIAFTYEGSGSVRHNVTSIAANGEVLQVFIDRHTPEIGTCDMASWLILIETDILPTGWTSEVVWNNVSLDSTALSPPADALKNISLEDSQETDMIYAVLKFSGIHSRLYPGVFSSWKMTHDGNEMDINNYGIYGSEYQYKRVIENDNTTFYIPITLYPEALAGIYVLSGEYQGKAFSTEAFVITY